MSTSLTKEYILNKPGPDPDNILIKPDVWNAFAVGALPARLALPVLAAQTRELSLNQFPSLSGIDVDEAARKNFLEANLAATQDGFDLDTQYRGPGLAVQLKHIAETTRDIATQFLESTRTGGIEALMALANRPDFTDVIITVEPDQRDSAQTFTISFPQVEAGLSDVKPPLDPRIPTLAQKSLAAQAALAKYTAMRMEAYLDRRGKTWELGDAGMDAIDAGRDLVLHAAQSGINPKIVLEGLGTWRAQQGWTRRTDELTTGTPAGRHLLDAGIAEGFAGWALSKRQPKPTVIRTSRELDQAGADFLISDTGDQKATAVSVKSGPGNPFFSVQPVEGPALQPLTDKLEAHRNDLASQLADSESPLRTEAAKLTPTPPNSGLLAQVPLAINTQAWKQIFAAAGMEDEELADATLNAAIQVKEAPAGDERLDALERAMRLAMELQSRGTEPISPELKPKEQRLWERYLPPQPVSPVQAGKPQAPLPPNAAGPDTIIDLPENKPPTKPEKQASFPRQLLENQALRIDYIADKLTGLYPKENWPNTEALPDITGGEITRRFNRMKTTFLDTGMAQKIKPKETTEIQGKRVDTYTPAQAVQLTLISEYPAPGIGKGELKKLFKAIQSDVDAAVKQLRKKHSKSSI